MQEVSFSSLNEIISQSINIKKNVFFLNLPNYDIYINFNLEDNEKNKIEISASSVFSKYSLSLSRIEVKKTCKVRDLNIGNITAENGDFFTLNSGNINVENITSQEINAGNISAKSIKSKEINAGMIYADYIESKSITCGNLNCKDIKCKDITCPLFNKI